MDLDYKPTRQDVMNNWPSKGNRMKWAQIWAEDGHEKNELIVKFMQFARMEIEWWLGGVQLNLIELVHLRRASESALKEIVRHDGEYRANGFTVPDFLPEEIQEQWMLSCMGFSIKDLRRKFGDIVSDKDLRKYLFHEHARRNGEYSSQFIEPVSEEFSAP